MKFWVSRLMRARRLSVVLLVLAISIATRASAHSALESSTPVDGVVVARVDRVELTFADDVQLLAVRLMHNNLDVPLSNEGATSGKEFAFRTPTLPDGDYEIAWSAAAEDGHIVSGRIGFTVSPHADMPGHHAASASLSASSLVAVVVKASLYATCLAAAGGAFFIYLFASFLTPALAQRLARAARVMAVAAIVATGLRIALAAAGIADGSDLAKGVALVMAGTEAGAVAVRLVGLLLVLVFVSNVRLVAALGGAIAAASFALTGHTLGVGPSIMPSAAIALHLVAVAYWIGALWPLLQFCRAPIAPPDLGAVLKRFGDIALAMVLVLGAAGLFVIWALLNIREDLIGSTYGRLLLLKLAFVAAMLVIAAVNKLRLTPRIAAGDASAVAAITTSIRIEIALAAVILLLTAAFTTVVGPPHAH